jgi:hypothetical protein
VSAIAIVNSKQCAASAHAREPCLFGTGFASISPVPSLDQALQAFAQRELRFLSLGSERSTHSHLLDAECA